MTIHTEKTFCPLVRAWGYFAILGEDRAWGFTREQAKNRLLARLNPSGPVMDEDTFSVYFQAKGEA
jgi:hypothetical protein